MKKIFSNAAAMAIFVAILIFLSMMINQNSQEKYLVERVIDGDTFIIDYKGSQEIVRLIGVDAPESVNPDNSLNTPEGSIASEFTKNALEGKWVELELDIQQRDKYGRILAYVYLEDKMFNKEILNAGYAKLATYPPNVKYEKELIEIIQKKAN